jgi:hypothetical protein
VYSNPKQVKKRFLGAGTASAVLALLFVFFILLPDTAYLLLSINGCTVYQAKVTDGEIFSVSYIHSLNKSEVEEFYQVRGDNIYLVKLVYATFGAGMSTDAGAEGGKTFSYDDKGRMVIEGYDKLLPSIDYFIGAVADHTLHIKGQDIRFTDIGAPREVLRFQII